MNPAIKALASALPARWGFEMMLTTLYRSPAWARDFITGDGPGHMGFRFGNEVLVSNLGWLALIGLVFLVTTSLSLKRYDRL
jgi:hypothetical protein